MIRFSDFLFTIPFQNIQVFKKGPKFDQLINIKIKLTVHETWLATNVY